MWAYKVGQVRRQDLTRLLPGQTNIMLTLAVNLNTKELGVKCKLQFVFQFI